MTVAELLDLLQDLDPDLEVVIPNGKWGFVEAGSVEPGFFDADAESFEPDEERQGDCDSVLISSG